MLNKCEFIGHVGQDPDIRTMDNGGKVANLSLAATEKWTKDGEKHEKTEWIRIVIFGKLAEIVEKWVKKGSKLYISGKMQTRKWTDREGVERYSTEIVLSGFDSKVIMLDSRNDSPEKTNDQGQKFGEHIETAEDMEDDLPF